ncbi:MAG: DUF4215 domain-containing protein [Sandaracinaceae bacterium]
MRKNKYVWLVIAAAALWGAGCDDGSSGTDGGDAGELADAGPTPDGGRRDAGPGNRDAGDTDGGGGCVPVDDGNECTTDECVGGSPVNTPRDGADCAGGGICNASGTCVIPTCTDGVQNGDETDVDCGGGCAPTTTCDDGEGCSVAGDCTSGSCMAMTCQAARCGDGVMQAGEVCDDGNDTDGDGCDDGASDACRPTGCGNGAVTAGEECDDMNSVDGDGCDNNCTVTACGNGVTAGTEVCDDGNTADADGCDSACAVETGYSCDATMVPSVCDTICGDGLLAGAETCDDGMGTPSPGDGCSVTCQIEGGWLCTPAPSTCTQVIACAAGETAIAIRYDTATPILDMMSSTAPIAVTSTEGVTRAVVLIESITHTYDGDLTLTLDSSRVSVALANRRGGSGDNYINTLFTDGASGSIASGVAPMTGSFRPEVPLARFVGQAAGDTWTLTVADAANGDTGTLDSWVLGLCTSATAPRCGDGTMDTGEECDDGNDVPDDTCTNYCSLTDGCGDGNVDSGEECDDDNLVSGDGCSSTCMVDVGCPTGQMGVLVTNGTVTAIPDNDTTTGVASGVSVASAGAIASMRVFLRGITHPADAEVDVYIDSPNGIRRELSTDNGTSTGMNYASTYLFDGAPVAITTGTAPFSGSFRSEQTLSTTAGTDFLGVSAAGTWNLRVFDDTASNTGSLDSWSLVACIDPAAPACGNGTREGTEECDDGNAVNTDTCTNRCVLVDGCGDGNLDAGEMCDDDNILSGDGCSSTCMPEPGYVCVGTPSSCVIPPTPITLSCTTGLGTTVMATGDEAVSARIALPFPISVYGSTMTHYMASSNGFIGLFPSDAGSISSTFTNATTVPSTSTPNGYLAPFWDDLDLDAPGLLSGVTGTAPNRVFTIEWNAHTYAATSTTPSGTGLQIQLQLHETGEVEFHYCAGGGDVDRASGSSATLATESLNGRRGLAISINTTGAVVPGTTAYGWTIP